ncbi:hypothetical protein [Kineococcus glutinatus]|uniref:Cell division protein FtsL n=1 Tax=Kineococcus glutinatus TaxID=1070872 RepID=A0ABP9HZ09_9ACTN
MSQPLIAARNASARALRARQAGASQNRPLLRVVAPPASFGARLPLPLACVLLLTGGLLVLLMMNISIARDAFTISDLQHEATLLRERQQALDEGLAAQAAPQALQQRATGLGMVPGPAPAHVVDGRVVGEPEEAQAPEPAAPGAPAPAPAEPAPTASAAPTP